MVSMLQQSRKDRPKQFVELVENKTLFSATLDRAASLTSNDPLVITNEDHRFLVAEELRNTGKENQEILLEPMARNTAPAACVAALKAMEMDKEAVILIMPSDHYMPEEFSNCSFWKKTNYRRNRIWVYQVS